MARKSPKKRVNVANVRLSLPLGTLGSLTVIDGNLGTNDSRKYLISCDGQWSIQGHTVGEGPISVGYAHSDYSVTEIKECLEQTAGFNRSDKIAQEQQRRLVRRAGVFDGDQDVAKLNDGEAIRTRLGFILEEGAELAIWAHNLDTAALTTGTRVEFEGTVFFREA